MSSSRIPCGKRKDSSEREGQPRSKRKRRDHHSPVIRREHASTFTARVDDQVKRKLQILKRCTLRPIVIYYEPAEAKLPSVKWRLRPMKGEHMLPMMYLHRQTSYIIGRNSEVCDIPVRHCSCSNQHAVLQYLEVQGDALPFIMDLKSMNGTRVNGERITPLAYVQLNEKDVLEFGLSSRRYLLLLKYRV